MSIKVLSHTGQDLDTAIAAVKEGLELGTGDVSTGGYVSRTQPNGRVVVNVENAIKSAFAGCINMTDISAPNMTSISERLCSGCAGLRSVFFPVATKANGYAFFGCTSLIDVCLPELTSCSPGMFASSTSLTSVDLPKCTNFSTAVFKNCKRLNTLILRSKTVCVYGAADVFDASPFKGAGESGLTGTVYVPAALIESYKTATNWSALYAAGTCNFLPIEKYTVDGTIGGELKTCVGITFDMSELTITENREHVLTATCLPDAYIIDCILWSSSNRGIVKVDDGVITPISDGVAIITATCGNYMARCTVTVNAGIESQNIMHGVGFNSGYISGTGVANTGNSDAYTDRFPVDAYAGQQIITTLVGVTATPSNSRICYYNTNGGFISYVNGTASSLGVTITSQVPNNAAFAAISVHQYTQLSHITISYDGEEIGYVNYPA